jgi:hypothetical protein
MRIVVNSISVFVITAAILLWFLGGGWSIYQYFAQGNSLWLYMDFPVCILFGAGILILGIMLLKLGKSI